jgi:hypothetical protein
MGKGWLGNVVNGTALGRFDHEIDGVHYVVRVIEDIPARETTPEPDKFKQYFRYICMSLRFIIHRHAVTSPSPEQRNKPSARRARRQFKPEKSAKYARKLAQIKNLEVCRIEKFCNLQRGRARRGQNAPKEINNYDR